MGEKTYCVLTEVCMLCGVVQCAMYVGQSKHVQGDDEEEEHENITYYTCLHSRGQISNRTESS